MYSQLLLFTYCSVGLFFLSRLLLLSWQSSRIGSPKVWLTILFNGLRIDLHLISAFTAIPWQLAPWLNQNLIAQHLHGLYLGVIWFAFALLEVSTPQFILEYDTRPNR